MPGSRGTNLTLIKRSATSIPAALSRFLGERKTGCTLTVELTSRAIFLDCVEFLTGLPILVVCLRVVLSAMSPSGISSRYIAYVSS